MDVLQIAFVATNQLIAQLIAVLPKLIISLVIWYLGRYLLSVSGKLLKRMDIEGTHIDERAVDTLAVLINAAGSVVLVLIILDYLGIGTSVVSAIAQGVTYAIAIALGLSFGRALEPHAQDIVDSINKFMKPTSSSSNFKNKRMNKDEEDAFDSEEE